MVNQKRAYGVGAPNLGFAPEPIVSRRAPVGSDVGYSIGQIWVYDLADAAVHEVYILASLVAGVAYWDFVGHSTSTINDVPHGGTGRATLTNHGVLIGAGTAAITQLAAAATGTVLAGVTGADPAFTATPAVTTLTATTLNGTTITTNVAAAQLSLNATTISVTGTDADIDINLDPKGTGDVFVAAGATIFADTISTSDLADLVLFTSNVIATGGTNPNVDLLISTQGTGDIIFSQGDAAGDLNIQITNTDNTAVDSRAGLQIAVGGATSLGDPYVRFEVSGVGASTMTMGLDNSAADIFVISNSNDIGTANALTLTQAGALDATTSITAGTTLTATLGNIQATNGNLVLNTAGNKIVSTSVAAVAAAGANSFGTVTLVNGTETVATTAVTANSIIILTRQTVGTTGANDLGILSVGTIVAGTSFVINAWTATNATALQADDQSVIGWMIIN